MCGKCGATTGFPPYPMRRKGSDLVSAMDGNMAQETQNPSYAYIFGKFEAFDILEEN